MRSRTLAALLAAALLSPAAWGQAGHGQHHAPAAKAPAAKPAEKPAPAKAAASPPAPRSDAYRSAFDGYRPFNADEPALDWRGANEAVREAGGHIGILKNAQPAPAKK